MDQSEVLHKEARRGGAETRLESRLKYAAAFSGGQGSGIDGALSHTSTYLE